MWFRVVLSTRGCATTRSSVPEMPGFRKSYFPKVRTGIFVSLQARLASGFGAGQQASRSKYFSCVR
jgi:hypothetical protein